MELICVDPRTDVRWLRLIETYPSSVFHSPLWMQVLSDTYGWDFYAYLLTADDGEPQAGLPLCRIDDHRGTRFISLPFSDYCDPLVEQRHQWDVLSVPVFDGSHPFFTRCLHNDIPLSDSRLAPVKRARWHGIDLHRDLETIWQGLESSARRAINKAQRDGVIIRPASEEWELRAFFDMHLRVRKYKYHLLAQPYALFKNIWRHFIEAQKGALMVAVQADEIIAGTLYLEWKDTLYYKFNASKPEAAAPRPSDLLIWNGIQYGKSKGYSHLDFGLSDWDQEGLLQFKRKYATEEKTISFLQHIPPRETSAWEKQTQQLFPQLTHLFTEQTVPDSVTEQAGELLYRFFV